MRSQSHIMAGANFGKAMLISELPVPCDGTMNGCSVSITGHVVAYNAREDVATIEHDGAMICVSTLLLDIGADDCPSLEVKSTRQFIGELKEVRARDNSDEWKRTLCARVVSAVDGLNMELHKQAIAAQRMFIERLDTAL